MKYSGSQPVTLGHFKNTELSALPQIYQCRTSVGWIWEYPFFKKLTGSFGRTTGITGKALDLGLNLGSTLC